MAGLSAKPIGRDEANKVVVDWHRHHKPVVGYKFAIGAMLDGELVGVVIVGRPVSRVLDNGNTAEVTRLCTNGAPNACSFLYGRAARTAFAMGYDKVGTYILASEPGTSLKAAGWVRERGTKGGSWSCPSRERQDNNPTEAKAYWSTMRKS